LFQNSHIVAQNISLFMKKIINSPLLFIVLAFLFPTVFLLSKNNYIYSSSQILSTLVFMFLIAVFVSFSIWLLSKIISKLLLYILLRRISPNYAPVVIQRMSKIQRAIMVAFGIIGFLLLSFGIIREMIMDKFLFISLFITITLFFVVVGYFSKLLIINLTLICLILFNGIFGLLNTFQKTTTSVSASTTSLNKNIVLKQKPNIYLVILESYNSLAIRKNVYDIDNKPLIEALGKYGFEIYENNYSNYNFTLASVSSIFMMDHHYYCYNQGTSDGSMYRKIIGGLIQNPVLQILSSNGYNLDYSQFSSGLYDAAPFLDNVKPQHRLQPIELFNNFFYTFVKIFKLNIWCPNIFSKLFQFTDYNIYTLHDKFEKTNFYIKPTFTLIYTGATHTPHSYFELPVSIQNIKKSTTLPLWRLYSENNYWKTAYHDFVIKSDSNLIQRIKNICEKDSTALVVLIGDHGATQHRNQWRGKKSDPNDNLIDNGISPLIATMDMFEIFLAIKWPNQKPHEYFSHVNLFREIFAILSEDTTILSTKVADNSYILDRPGNSFMSNTFLCQTVKNGKPLDKWEILKK
jgi:hypothetical protein